MNQATQEAPTVGAVETENTGQHSNHEAKPCPGIVPQPGQKIKPSAAAAGEVILPHLASGRNNARKRCDLMNLTGLRDRAFRHGIEALRRGGVVICADERGYYLPVTVGEVLDFIAQEERRARSTFFTLQPARQLAAQMQAHELGEQLKAEGV